MSRYWVDLWKCSKSKYFPAKIRFGTNDNMRGVELSEVRVKKTSPVRPLPQLTERMLIFKPGDDSNDQHDGPHDFVDKIRVRHRQARLSATFWRRGKERWRENAVLLRKKLSYLEKRAGGDPYAESGRANFTGLVLGCIEADFCRQRLNWKLSPRSTH